MPAFGLSLLATGFSCRSAEALSIEADCTAIAAFVAAAAAAASAGIAATAAACELLLLLTWLCLHRERTIFASILCSYVDGMFTGATGVKLVEDMVACILGCIVGVAGHRLQLQCFC